MIELTLACGDKVLVNKKDISYIRDNDQGCVSIHFYSDESLMIAESFDYVKSALKKIKYPCKFGKR